MGRSIAVREKDVLTHMPDKKSCAVPLMNPTEPLISPSHDQSDGLEPLLIALDALRVALDCATSMNDDDLSSKLLALIENTAAVVDAVAAGQPSRHQQARNRP